MGALDKYQHTIEQKIQFKGVGLHGGQQVNLTLIPSKPNTGIVFKRIDLKDNNIIQGDFRNVSSAKLCTKIENKFGASVSTIEHLLAALYGEGVDNLLIEVDGPEIPIMDGSAIEFVNSIRKYGIRKQDLKRKFIRVLKSVKVEKDSKFIILKPYKENLNIDFEIVYKNKLISTQRESINLLDQDIEHMYRSRTFGLFEDIEKIRSMGLGKGGSLDNAIIVKDEKVLNSGGLRSSNEFVLHKILDCLGDMILAGNRMFGSITCSRGGHQLTNELLQKLFLDKSNWEYVELKANETEYSEINYSKPLAVNA